MADMPVFKVPTIDDLRRAYEEGVPQTLLSGVEVQMRPVRPDALLISGKIPDILTPLVLGMLFPQEQGKEQVFPDEVRNPVDDFLQKERAKAADAVEFVRAVDAVCEAALLDPSIVPYLSLADRMWIFRLAFMPAEVLSTFRLGQAADVGAVDGSQEQPRPTERDDAGDRLAEPVESLHGAAV